MKPVSVSLSLGCSTTSSSSTSKCFAGGRTGETQFWNWNNRRGKW